MAKQNQQKKPEYEEPKNEDQYHLRLFWFVVPIILFGMYVYLKSIMPVLSWDQIMDLLHVQDRQRYTMLAILCLSLTLITAIWRILRK